MYELIILISSTSLSKSMSESSVGKVNMSAPLVIIGPSYWGGEKPCSDSVSVLMFIVTGELVGDMLVLCSVGEAGEYIGEAG